MQERLVRINFGRYCGDVSKQLKMENELFIPKLPPLTPPVQAPLYTHLYLFDEKN